MLLFFTRCFANTDMFKLGVNRLNTEISVRHFVFPGGRMHKDISVSGRLASVCLASVCPYKGAGHQRQIYSPCTHCRLLINSEESTLTLKRATQFTQIH